MTFKSAFYCYNQVLILLCSIYVRVFPPLVPNPIFYVSFFNLQKNCIHQEWISVILFWIQYIQLMLTKEERTMYFASEIVELHWFFSWMVLTYLWTENVSEQTISVYIQHWKCF